MLSSDSESAMWTLHACLVFALLSPISGTIGASKLFNVFFFCFELPFPSCNNCLEQPVVVHTHLIMKVNACVV